MFLLRIFKIATKKKFLTLIILISVTFNIFGGTTGDTIIYNNPNKFKLIGYQLANLEDKSSKLTINDILNPINQKKFIKQESDVFTSPPSNSAYWFKFNVQNNSKEDIWFEAGGSYSAWEIDFYRPDSLGNYSYPVKTGALRTSNNKEYPSQFYCLKLANGQEENVKTFYVRIKSGVSPELPFFIGTIKALNAKNNEIYFITYAFLGMMAIMFLYNLFLFFATKDKIYLSYAFFVFMNAICYTFNNNFSFFGDNFWWWNKHIAWQFLGDLSSTIFILHFLNLKKTLPISFKIYLILITSDFIIAILNLFGLETVLLMDEYVLVSMLLIINTIFTGIYLLIKGHRNAKFFMLSWSFLLISIVIFMMVINGLLPYNLLTRYSVYLGISIEALLFSMALADRFNILKKEKEEALVENVRLIQNNNIILEKIVKERTEDLAFKNEKLHVVLENINQQKEQISKQNKELYKMNKYNEEMTNMIVHDLKNPLNIILNLAENELVLQSGKTMMNLVMNILNVYKNKETQMSLDKNNFSLLNISKTAINEVLFLAKLKNISIETEINKKTIVNIDKDIIIRVFINILNNAIKFTPYNGKIFINSEKDKQNKIKVSISDTGKGIPKDQLHVVFEKFGQVIDRKSINANSSGIGLTYCKIAVEAHGGIIGVDSEEGVGSTFWFMLSESGEIEHPILTSEEENINTSDLEKDFIKSMVFELNKLEFYEVGEILKIINKFEATKYPNIKIFAEKIKNAVFSGNLVEYDRLLYLE